MALCEGATATIEGLISRADLNGKRVTLLTFADGRWGTRLIDSSERLRVKPSNLVLYDAVTARLSAQLSCLSHDVLADLAAAMARASQSAHSLADAVLAKHARVAESIFQSPDLLACVLSSFELQDAHAAMVSKIWEQAWKRNMEQRWNEVLRPAPLAVPGIDINAGSSVFMMAAPPSGAFLCCAYNNRSAKILDPSMRVRHSINRFPNHLVQGIAAGEDRIYLSAGGGPDAASRVIAFTSDGGTTGVEFVFENFEDEPSQLALADNVLFAAVDENTYESSRIIALNAHTLEQQFTFGSGFFQADADSITHRATSMTVAGNALYIGRGCSHSLQVFSLAGEHLREVSGDFRVPLQVQHFKERLYLLEEEEYVEGDDLIDEESLPEEEGDDDSEGEDIEEGDDDEADGDDLRRQARKQEIVESLSTNKRVFELSLAGETLQVWKVFPGEPGPTCPFYKRWFWVHSMCVMGDRLILRQGKSDTQKLVALRL